jgi:hypothetical protein
MKRKSSPHVAINIKQTPPKKAKNQTVINIAPSPPKIIGPRRLFGTRLNNTLKKLSSSPRKSPVRRSPRKSPAKAIRPLSQRQIDNLTFAPYAINF